VVAVVVIDGSHGGSLSRARNAAMTIVVIILAYLLLPWRTESDADINVMMSNMTLKIKHRSSILHQISSLLLRFE